MSDRGAILIAAAIIVVGGLWWFTSTKPVRKAGGHVHNNDTKP